MSETITIHHIYLSGGHDFKGRFGIGRLEHGVVDAAAAECVAGRGLVGDRYFDFEDNYKGQVSLIALEAIEAMEAELGLAVEDYSAFRRNVVVSGVDLNALVGKRFRIGGVTLEGTEKCAPCLWMEEAVGTGAREALNDRGGLRCRVLSSGELAKGESRIEEVA